MRALLSCLALGLLTLPGFAQDTKATEPATAQQWIEKLGDVSYQVRRKAEAALSRMGEAVLQALEKAAQNHDDPEVRWRARRLADRIRRGEKVAEGEGQGVLTPRDDKVLPPSWRDRDLDEMFGSLFERLEREFGIDVPARSFFHDDFFRDLQQQMEAFRRRMDELARSPGALGESRTFKMSMGPDGVEVQVEEKDASGEVQTKTYSAPDLETFREKYPEIAREFLDRRDGSLAFRIDPEKVFQKLPWRTPAQPLLETEPAQPGPRLGVLARPISSDLAAFLGLDEGHGLLVESVTENSLAAALGIQPRDVLLKVDDRPIRDAADVRQALAKAGKTVKVVVNRRGKELTLEAPFESTQGAGH